MTVTDEERQAYELLRGEPYPDPPRPQDEMLAGMCFRQLQREKRKAIARARRRSFVGPPSEREEQLSTARLLDALQLVWIHVPNEGKRSKRYGASLADQGLKAGFPDILIFTPPPRFPEVRFVAIELKRQKGGTVTRLQKEWQHELRECGGIAEICRGFDEVANQLERLGYMEGWKRKHVE